ncbi:MAG TPA: sigma-70 family RNA polymerase sigma factor [Blastocatellia bacterium]|nr:sigma-70 family RNA polymerase sigma factor [Blastocatellia bacterium]
MQTLTKEWTVSELLERCSRQPCDNAAWEEFVRRYQSTIRTSVTKTFHRKAMEDLDRKPQFPDDLIDDLVQDVYKRLITDRNRALTRFEGEYANSIYQYLTAISVNVVRDYFREVRAQKRPKVSYSLDELLENGENPRFSGPVSGYDGKPVSASPSFTMQEIEEALRKVVTGKNPDRDILIFQLRYYEGLTLEEIARVTGGKLSAISVGSILNRMIKKIRRILAPETE